MINYEDYHAYINKIVSNVTSGYVGYDLCKEDLVQRAWFELIKAEARYDANKGAKVVTYAYRAIEGGIKDEIGFQLNRIGVTGKEGIVAINYVSMDEDNGLAERLSEELVLSIEKDESAEDHSNEIRRNLQLLSHTEMQVLSVAYGIGYERTTNIKKIAKLLNMSELEVKKVMETGKNKLRELSDGRA